MSPLPRSFFTRSSLIVAKELLGTLLVRRIGRTLLSGIIVETEAYRQDDPASHSYRGITDRTRVMFGIGGHLYVYFTYGMHHCANVVTGPDGRGEAVLIRAVEPVSGIERMAVNRAKDVKSGRRSELISLTNGPGKLAQAFALTREHSGADLTDGSIFIAEGERIPRKRIVAATRIGISVAQEQPWRFYIDGNEWVSKKSQHH